MDNQTALTSEESQLDSKPIKVELVEQKKEKPKIWNSLERTKIFVGLLTPLMILAITLIINSNINDRNKRDEHNRRIFAKRQDIYDKVGPLLNDIYSYFLYVGKWKQLSPDDIISHKRELDKTIYTNIPYFDTASVFIKYYNGFMDETFATGQGWGKDAALRTEMDLHKVAIDTTKFNWQKRWNDSFTEEDNRENIKKTYFALLRQVSSELDLEVKGQDIDKTIEVRPIDTLKRE